MEATSGMATQIQREIAIEASPETVWDFLVDSELAKRWMGTQAVLDPRPGGEYRVHVVNHSAVGEFVEVDPPRRLVWTWGWSEESGLPIPPGSSTIEVDLVPDGDGTLLKFAHSGLPDEDAVKSHAHGWDHYLERLKIAARGDDPGRDSWLDEMT